MKWIVVGLLTLACSREQMRAYEKEMAAERAQAIATPIGACWQYLKDGDFHPIYWSCACVGEECDAIYTYGALGQVVPLRCVAGHGCVSRIVPIQASR